MIKLDQKDYVILDVLRENSSLSMQNIAKKTGIPVATVHNRIKKMRAEGVIKKYTVEIDKAKLGRPMSVFIAVKAGPKADHAAMLREICRHELVEEGAVIAGQFDLIFKIRAKGMEDLNSFVLQYLRKSDSVVDTSTMIAYQLIEKG
jgi:Lrp/AsnC family transcriptional regulator for asnA, asnC and gidA